MLFFKIKPVNLVTKRILIVLRCLLLSFLFILGVNEVSANSKTPSNGIVSVNIPAQLTKDALLSIAIKHSVQVMFSPNVVGDLKSNKVEGEMSINQALQGIIAKTPLQLIRLTKNTYIIQRKKSVLADIPISIIKTNNQNQLKETNPKKQIEHISIVGSHIKRSEITNHVSTRILDKQFILSTGAVSGEELIRAIPQIGEIPFNNERAIGGVNDARGDVSSINLRGFGTGYTLTLLNGRRLVQHPGTQTEKFVPVNTVNINTLPVKSLDSIEILLGGGAALYGSDAVAGVVNYVTDNQKLESEFSVNYGGSTNSNLEQLSLTTQKSFVFDQPQALINISLWYYRRGGILANELAQSASQDRRQSESLNNEFIGDSQLDNRSISTPWLEFQHPLDGTLHIQPTQLGNCLQLINDELCTSEGQVPRALRFDRAVTQSMTSDVERINLHSYFSRSFDNDIELFADTYLYYAKTERKREQTPNLSSQRFTIAKTAAYNPFNENILLRRYRVVDAGLRDINVYNQSGRMLLGVKGLWNDWDWESALLYSRAKTNDTAKNRVQASAFQQAINNPNEAYAYNPFNGGSIEYPSTIDSTLNDFQVINPFLIDVERTSTTSLAQVDIKWSTPDFYELEYGSIELAVGLEFRRESYVDDRDELLDGSHPFIDSVTGIVLSQSDVLGSSHTFDSAGSRNIASAYLDSYVPLSKSTTIQLALRCEDYSDIGSVLKPKIAISSQLNEKVMLRASLADGFRAPNLPQIAEKGIARFNAAYDPVTDLSYGINEIRTGNADLKPEKNKNISFGGAFELSEQLNISVDWWQIKQKDVIGIVPVRTLLLYDALTRSTGKPLNNVIRDELGYVSSLENQYVNLNPRRMSGVDYSANFENKTPKGLFSINLNVAQLLRYEQGLDPISAEILQAQADGNLAIPKNSVVENVGDLLEINGRPSWRIYLNLDWKQDDFTAGLTYNYVSKLKDDSVWNSNGDLLPVDDFNTVGVYFNYSVVGSSSFDKTNVLFGIRNITNQLPPLADESFGYFSDVHSNRGRYVYLDITSQF